jgi:hypothetical protein
MAIDGLRQQIVALRRAGKSRSQIRSMLAPIGNSVINDALRGEPPPEWTKRPNAKDDLRASFGRRAWEWQQHDLVK